jgi:MFS family permease
VALASGFGQFGFTATLGDVARHFGHVFQGSTITDRAGLSGTQLGLGLAVVRLSSLGGLPITAWADRAGRRKVLLFACGLGLAITAASALSPTYWLFVIIFALGRPFLSAAAAVAQVEAAELTDSSQRASAVALVAAGYAVGAGATAGIYGLAGGTLGYRGILGLALIPLIGLPFASRWVSESDRFLRNKAMATGAPHPRHRRPPLPGPAGTGHTPRLCPGPHHPGPPTASCISTPRTSTIFPASRSSA